MVLRIDVQDLTVFILSSNLRRNEYIHKPMFFQTSSTYKAVIDPPIWFPCCGHHSEPSSPVLIYVESQLIEEITERRIDEEHDNDGKFQTEQKIEEKINDKEEVELSRTERLGEELKEGIKQDENNKNARDLEMETSVFVIDENYYIDSTDNTLPSPPRVSTPVLPDWVVVDDEI